MERGADYARSEWIHDKYDEDDDSSRRPQRRSRPSRYEKNSPDADPFGRDRDRDRDRNQASVPGTKIRIENLHWDLNETDLTGLFERIGPISRISIDYDRSGRSTGTAYVTYPDPLDARDAVRQFDGANAKGQPIRLAILPSGAGANSRGGRNPFDSVQPPSRSLFERIEGGRDSSSRSRNRERARSRSPGQKRADLRAAAGRENIDRYVPSDRSQSRSPRRRGNDRGGADRRRGGGRDGRDGRDGGRRQDRRAGRSDEPSQPMSQGRPRKTQEELDAEMDNYFNSAPKTDAATEAAAKPSDLVTSAPANAGTVADDDIDMIE